MAIVVIIDALRVIKIASIIKQINFKKKTIVMLISVFLSGIISIILALKGYGVWALVSNTLLSRLFNTIGLWIKTEWISIKDFSFKSLKSLFSYGSWLLLSSILNTFFANINILIIGRLFSPAILGFYTTAKQYKNMAVGQIFTSVNSVSFPVFSQMQDDKENLKSSMRKFSQQILLITLPIILSVLVVAKPFIIILLTEKWAPMIPFLQLFCIIGVVFPLNAMNVQILVAQGYSKVRFKVILFMFCLRIINIFIMYRWGVIYILTGEVLITFISLLINTYFTKKFLNYSLFSQLQDIKHYIFGGFLAVIAGMATKLFLTNLYLLLLAGTITTVGIFFIFQYFFNRSAFNVLLHLKEKLILKLKSERTI
jgi:O-antigen/teichoic acid export membrane protein